MVDLVTMEAISSSQLSLPSSMERQVAVITVRYGEILQFKGVTKRSEFTVKASRRGAVRHENQVIIFSLARQMYQNRSSERPVASA